ncbi:hypothetical protein C0081_21330 [Cohaesibacter celericrescens]|uniref:Uncharacterized protein n=1 Tax=Cohaesibacter celericrescens TaxID=2067669 RepID=A0A2N5XK23_9HYPH|nr:hypothetical protein C0081_21330 [Cohaesibacter celericrescens]
MDIRVNAASVCLPIRFKRPDSVDQGTIWLLSERALKYSYFEQKMGSIGINAIVQLFLFWGLTAPVDRLLAIVSPNGLFLIKAMG